MQHLDDFYTELMPYLSPDTLYRLSYVNQYFNQKANTPLLQEYRQTFYNNKPPHKSIPELLITACDLNLYHLAKYCALNVHRFPRTFSTMLDIVTSISSKQWMDITRILIDVIAKNRWILRGDTLDNICLSGDLPLLQYAMCLNIWEIPDHHKHMNFAARSGNIQMLEWLVQRYGMDDTEEYPGDRCLESSLYGYSTLMIDYIAQTFYIDKGIKVGFRSSLSYNLIVKNRCWDTLKYAADKYGLVINTAELLLYLSTSSYYNKNIPELISVLQKFQLDITDKKRLYNAVTYQRFNIADYILSEIVRQASQTP